MERRAVYTVNKSKSRLAPPRAERRAPIDRGERDKEFEPDCGRIRRDFGLRVMAKTQKRRAAETDSKDKAEGAVQNYTHHISETPE